MNENDPSDEFPREDIIYGGIRRLNHSLTLRLALKNPLAMIIIMIFVGISGAIFTISIGHTMSGISIRDSKTETVEQIAIRSQYASPYVKTLICIDSRLRPVFESNIYTRKSQIIYEEIPKKMFSYLFGHPEDSM